MDFARNGNLFEATRAGDGRALNQLLALCQPDVRRYARRNCMISDVDDAVQESLLILSRHLSLLRVLEALSSWLFRVVRRERHRMARKALSTDPWDEQRAEAWVSTRSSQKRQHDLTSARQSLPATIGKCFHYEIWKS